MQGLWDKSNSSPKRVQIFPFSPFLALLVFSMRKPSALQCALMRFWVPCLLIVVSFCYANNAIATIEISGNEVKTYRKLANQELAKKSPEVHDEEAKFGGFSESKPIFEKPLFKKPIPLVKPKPIPIPVYKPIPKPIPIVKPIPKPVIVKKPIPVPIYKPIPKPIPIFKPIPKPVIVEKPIPIPVYKPVPRSIPIVKPIPKPVVEKKPVPVPVFKKPIEKPIPFVKPLPKPFPSTKKPFFPPNTPVVEP